MISSVDTRAALFGIGNSYFIKVLSDLVFGDNFLQEPVESTILSTPYLQLLRSNILTTQVAQLEKQIRLSATEADEVLKDQFCQHAKQLEANIQSLTTMLDPLSFKSASAFFEGQDIEGDECNFLYVISVINAAIIYVGFGGLDSFQC